MSDFDRVHDAFGAGVGRAGYAQIDQGLRTYMLGVYNHMVLGLALTGLIALGTNMLAVTQRARDGRSRRSARRCTTAR